MSDIKKMTTIQFEELRWRIDDLRQEIGQAGKIEGGGGGHGDNARET